MGLLPPHPRLLPHSREQCAWPRSTPISSFQERRTALCEPETRQGKRIRENREPVIHQEELDDKPAASGSAPGEGVVLG